MVAVITPYQQAMDYCADACSNSDVPYCDESCMVDYQASIASPAPLTDYPGAIVSTYDPERYDGTYSHDEQAEQDCREGGACL